MMSLPRSRSFRLLGRVSKLGHRQYLAIVSADPAVSVLGFPPDVESRVASTVAGAERTLADLVERLKSKILRRQDEVSGVTLTALDEATGPSEDAVGRLLPTTDGS